MASWQRNLYVLTAAELIAVAGFAVIWPFLPYYVQELGVTNPDQIKLWSGWLLSSQAIARAIVAPIWGSLADRYGRKIMVERAMLGGALVFVGMGLAQTVQQVLALRILQGILTGTVPAATALVASTVPRERSGSSLGLLQTGVYLGASLGPLAGGVIADSLGYRATFWVPSACLLSAGLAVHWLVNEGPARPEQTAGRQSGRLWDGLLIVLRSPWLQAVFLVRMVVWMGNRVIKPMLSLFIQQIVVQEQRLATITGVISGLGALAGAAGAFFLGRASDKVGHRKMLLLCSFGLTVCCLPQSLVVNPLQLGILQAMVGFLMAGMLASLAALLATLVPEGRYGSVYGVGTTIIAVANALAPMLGAGVAIWWGLRPIFVVAAGLFALGGILALWLLPASDRLPGRVKGV